MATSRCTNLYKKNPKKQNEKKQTNKQKTNRCHHRKQMGEKANQNKRNRSIQSMQRNQTNTSHPLTDESAN